MGEFVCLYMNSNVCFNVKLIQYVCAKKYVLIQNIVMIASMHGSTPDPKKTAIKNVNQLILFDL